ncbi:hypothetical protein VK70_01070 [Paenibacillus durus ATCC 35681]|uniref:Uncharacterized protein n=1 Tax=Paenibacillus durus ATCC 35681 TaxID=1333534 RepID=A0A0F7F6N2_PAEDU|nr:hypothetical protein VK70_01070 [Paenibacillus durus ATCC 35681]
MHQPGVFYGGGFVLLTFIRWLISIGLGIYGFFLFVKLARRGIEALDLYIYAKNREIRDHYESVHPKE